MANRYLLGFDVGSSSVKASLVNANIYSLGMKTMFLNRVAFETTVERLRKRFKKRRGRIA